MKKIFTLLLAVSLVFSSANATWAYFTDTVTASAVITSGNIQIAQYEQERCKDADGNYTQNLKNYTQHQVLYPLVQNGALTTEKVAVNGHDVLLPDENSQNYMDKIVSVKNIGSNPAYVRTFIAVPTGGYEGASPVSENWLRWNINTDTYWSWKDDKGNWNMIKNVPINGVQYDIYIATYKDALASGKTTCPNLLGFYVDSSLTSSDNGYYFTSGSQKVNLTDVSYMEILVATQATQTTTFNDPYTALNKVFGTPDKNHPWVATTFYHSTDKLNEALSNGVRTIRLTDGMYNLPETLPANVSIIGHGDNVILNAPQNLSASGVEFSNVTFANAVNFKGNGEFHAVNFQDSFDAEFNNPSYITNCIFASTFNYTVTKEAVRDTVLLEDCVDNLGNPVTK